MRTPPPAPLLNVSAYTVLERSKMITKIRYMHSFELLAGSSLVGPSIERGFVFVRSCGRLFVL